MQAFCFGVLIKNSNLENYFSFVNMTFIIIVVMSICKLFIVKFVTILEFLFIIPIAFDIYICNRTLIYKSKALAKKNKKEKENTT